jgi:lysophosphatidate acyltransferase
MTVADIPVLATKVRDQMVEALREISVKPSGSSKDDKTEAKLPSQPDSTSKIDEVPTTDTKDSPARAAVQLEASASTASLGSSFSASTFPESERAAETEDEEGIVMVGRPE